MSQNLSSTAVVIGTLRVNSFPPGKFFMFFLCQIVVCWFFSKSTFSKNSSEILSEYQTYWIKIQAWPFVGLDLALNCLQKLSADDNKWQRINSDQTAPDQVINFSMVFVFKITAVNVFCPPKCPKIQHRPRADVPRFIQASLCKIQGLLNDFPTVFKDWKLMKILIYTIKLYFGNARLHYLRY